MRVIAEHPTAEMYALKLEIDVWCARCGSSVSIGGVKNILYLVEKISSAASWSGLRWGDRE